jgi:hypothetical protein
MLFAPESDQPKATIFLAPWRGAALIEMITTEKLGSYLS